MSALFLLEEPGCSAGGGCSGPQVTKVSALCIPSGSPHPSQSGQGGGEGPVHDLNSVKVSRERGVGGDFLTPLQPTMVVTT